VDSGSGYQVDNKLGAVVRRGNQPPPMDDATRKPGVAIVLGINDPGL
jgi:hypothetical protein